MIPSADGEILDRFYPHIINILRQDIEASKTAIDPLKESSYDATVTYSPTHQVRILHRCRWSGLRIAVFFAEK